MKKILVIGSCGAGKSTFSQKLAKRKGLNLIHLDQYFWKPGWTPSTDEEWEKKVKELILFPSWVMDGNYASSLKYRIPESDTIFFLDFPRRINLYRAFVRTIKYLGKTRPDSADGCPERFNIQFFKYIWDYRKNHLERAEKAIIEYGANKKVFKFKHPNDVTCFLNSNLQEP